MKTNVNHSRHPARRRLRIARRVAPRCSTNRSRSVSERYSPVQRSKGNRIRLWAVVTLFKLSPSDIAKATGFSRPYVARLLSLNDNLPASPTFWRVLEQKLGMIIEQRTAQYFTVPAVSVQRGRQPSVAIGVEITH